MLFDDKGYLEVPDGFQEAERLLAAAGLQPIREPKKES